MRKKFIAGNWKMYTNAAGAKALAEGVAKGVTDNAVTVAVCPPFPWLGLVADALRGSAVAVGGQNCHYAPEGAYTGEVSPRMLLDAGCQYVIVGHSERRNGLMEPDRFLNLKVKAATAAGLKVVFCVGELLSERESGMTEDVIWFQVAAGLNGLTAEAVSKLVIAYEPVWAIGTGKVATPAQAQEVHSFIRGRYAHHYSESVAQNLTILYGGSVKPDNAADILKQPDVDGALVGGASLKSDSFLGIVQAAKGYAQKHKEYRKQLSRRVGPFFELKSVFSVPCAADLTSSTCLSKSTRLGQGGGGDRCRIQGQVVRVPQALSVLDSLHQDGNFLFRPRDGLRCSNGQRGEAA